MLLTEYFFRLWAWICSLRGKGTFLIYWIYCLIADTWWYTHDDTQCRCSPDSQLLPVLGDISCGFFNIRDWSGKTMYLPGMVCDMFWLIIYNISQYSCNIVPSRHLVCRGGKGIVDLCSRSLGGTSPPGCAKPASSVAMRIPSVSHSFPSHLIQRHPGSPWRLAGFAKAPHFCTSHNLNPGIHRIGVTQLELPAPKAIVRIAEAEAWCPPSMHEHVNLRSYPCH